jgi:D-apionate oxidoisomerase
MNKVVLVGAGGKMGLRIIANLRNSEYQLSCLEVSPEGIGRMKAIGVNPAKPEEVLPEADFMIMAVPDIWIGKVAQQYVPLLRKGAMSVHLDPAAPLAGHLPDRKDISYFASHPCHPSVFNWEPTEEAQMDFFGGIKAKQVIVCALIQGPDADYARGEKLARTMYAPVTVAHRITIEQMGILEPALSETFGAALVAIMREGVDRVVELGVPRDAAWDFFLGHINIELALLFGKLPGGKFSDAALKAIDIGKSFLIRDNWKEVFEWDNVKEQIKAIT